MPSTLHDLPCFRVRLRNPLDGSSWETIVRAENAALAMLTQEGVERRRGKLTRAISARPFEGWRAGR